MWSARLRTAGAAAACVLRPCAVRAAAGLTIGWHVAQQHLGSASCDSKAQAFLTPNFIADAAEKAGPALVNITVGGRGPFAPGSSGSGFIVQSDGLILTNTHVVQQAASGGNIIITLSDGITKLKGVVQHADSVADVAIVRVQHDAPLPTVSLGTSANLRPGEFVVALGAPHQLTNSVTAGIVSAVQRTRADLGLRDARNQMEYIQTDAAINQGNSGGPLLNLQGEVIGINTMKAMGMDGIAFAIPIDEVKHVVGQLQKHGRVLRPYLGLKFVEMNPKVAADFRVRAAEITQRAEYVPESGLYVMQVTPGSPAQRGGVRVGDTIVGLDQTEIRTTKEFLDGLTDKVGATVHLKVQRRTATEIVSVVVQSQQ